MEKIWTVLIILIQLNFTVLGSMYKDSLVSIMCVDIQNSFDQVAIFSDACHSNHTIEKKEDKNHHEAVEHSMVETDYVNNNTFNLIGSFAAPEVNLAFSEYYLHHLPAVYVRVNIPPPRA